VQPADGAAAWFLTRLLAILLLLGASGLLYHVATSDEFRVASVVVAGNRLVPASQLEAAASVYGVNIFWVRQGEVRRRLQAVPAVQSVRVSAVLPNRLDIRIAERAPAAVWETPGGVYLVDERGRVLGQGEGAAHLTRIRDVSDGEARPSGDAIAAVAGLQQLLPQMARLTPRAYEYDHDNGVSVLSDSGLRVRFGDSDDLEWKVYAMVAVTQDLQRGGKQAELIDVRFRDRPYVR